ncbi:hypothetical protein RAA17_20900 [Komagataeibacter rhaeticus]|nr:hypothetical protein [Komagataeibacter rhaeticus]
MAGVACTQWDVTTDQGNATACVTEDGVVLQEIGVDGDGLKGKLEATKVVYGPIPDSMFQPPEGYRKVEPPRRPAPRRQGREGRMRSRHPFFQGPFEGLHEVTRLAHGLRRTVMMGALLLAGPGYAHAADGAAPIPRPRMSRRRMMWMSATPSIPA